MNTSFERHLVIFTAAGPLIGWVAATAAYFTVAFQWEPFMVGLVLIGAIFLLPVVYVFGAALGLVTGYLAYRLRDASPLARWIGTLLVGTGLSAGVGILIESLPFPMLRVMTPAGFFASAGSLLIVQALERKSPAPVRSGADQAQ